MFVGVDDGMIVFVGIGLAVKVKGSCVGVGVVGGFWDLQPKRRNEIPKNNSQIREGEMRMV